MPTSQSRIANSVPPLAETTLVSTLAVCRMGFLASSIRITYGLVTYAVMLVLLRVWGEAAPYFSWWYSLGWAMGFVPFFLVLFFYVRTVGGKARAALDRLRPLVTQSLVTSFLYAVNYLCVSTSNPHVEGPVQVVLAQIPLLFSVLFSVALFRRVYAVMAWAGAFLVLFGVLFTSLVPEMMGSSSSSTDEPFWWNIVYCAGMLPLGLLPIFFEGFQKAKGEDGEVNTLELRLLATNAFLTVWIIVLLPAFMVFQQPPPGEFIENSQNFFSCVLLGTDDYGDDCQTGRWVFWVTIVVAAAQAHSQVIISRAETGAFATLVLTLSPFLADLIYPIQPLMGEYTEAISGWDAVGAVFCIFGVLLFAYSDHVSLHFMASDDALLPTLQVSDEDESDDGTKSGDKLERKYGRLASFHCFGWRLLPLFVGRYEPVERSPIIKPFLKTEAPSCTPSPLLRLFQ